MNLKDLQYLKYLNDIKFLVIIAIVIGGIYLSIKSPKIKTTMEVELYKTKLDTLNSDTLKLDTNATINN